MAEPETPIWDLLDKIGLPFRLPLSDLLTRHGTLPCVWLPSLAVCRLPTTPLLPGLSPFDVQVQTGVDPTRPAFHFSAHYRVHGAKTVADRLSDHRTERNVADVIAALSSLLGPGEAAATSNTLGRVWRFGMARLRVIGFPPRLNPLANSRHQSDPGSQTEAHVSVEPGWMPPLTKTEQGWLRAFTPQIPSEWLAPGQGLAPPWRRLPTDIQPPPSTGSGLAGGGAAFASVIGPYVQLVPRAHVIGLTRALAAPARGGGYATLALDHAPPDLPGLRPHRLQLISDRFSDCAFEREADRLSQLLGLPCKVERYLDD